jgi:hypothetical protein
MSEVEEVEELQVETEEQIAEVSAPLIRTQTVVVQISGRLGQGKTWSLVAEVVSACRSMEIKRIITNVLLLPEFFKMYPGIEVIYTNDIREVFKHLSPDVPTALIIDELSKSVNSRLAKSTLNLVMVRLLGDIRKSGVRFFAYSHQHRKESDTLVRTQNSLIMLPRHELDVRGHPLYWTWRSNEEFEIDFQHGEDKYKYAIPMASMRTLPEIDGVYDTFQKIPMQLNPGLSEEEVPIALAHFLSFCKERDYDLRGKKNADVKIYLRRWNDNDKSHEVPYTPKALEILFSEIIAQGLTDSEEKAEFKRIGRPAKEIPSGPIDCECGATIEQGSHYEHLRTKKHRNGMFKLNHSKSKTKTTGKSVTSEDTRDGVENAGTREQPE